jgi:hypothetical protein
LCWRDRAEARSHRLSVGCAETRPRSGKRAVAGSRPHLPSGGGLRGSPRRTELAPTLCRWSRVTRHGRCLVPADAEPGLLCTGCRVGCLEDTPAVVGDDDLLTYLPRATGPKADVAFSDRSLLPSHAPGSHPVRVVGRVVWHFGREARLQGLSPLESPLPPDGGLDRPGPDALLGFQSLQGFPPHRLEPTLPSALLSQAWRGPANR